MTSTAHLRYRGQSFDLAIDAGADLATAFHDAHRARYGFALPEREIELVTLRASGRGLTPPIAPPRQPPEEGDPQVGRLTSRWKGRPLETPILSRGRLKGTVHGPALIVEYSATTWLPPDARAQVDDGVLRITLE